MADAPPEAPVRLWRRRGAIPVAVFIALLLIVGLLPAPYVIETPGPVFDTLGTTTVSGSRVAVVSIPSKTTYTTSGSLDLLTISVLGGPGGTPSWLDLLRAWLLPSEAVVPTEEVYAPGVTTGEANQEDTAEMKQSQQNAIAAALLHLGYHVKDTVSVTGVEKGYPAAGVLKTGDTITTAAGSTLNCAASLQQAVAKNGSSTPLSLGVTRSGSAQTVSITPRTVTSGTTKDTLLGIGVADTFSFPFSVTLRLQDVGGPSAGMMFALGIIDKLTPGSLTGGKHVAGTGTIDCTGAVGPIGGIIQKMYAAKGAGATVFLAPKGDCSELVGHVPSGLSVYAVSTLDDSLAVLKAVSTGSSTGRLPRC
jgi:Lon-like protease